jgi:hypothetical protein
MSARSERGMRKGIVQSISELALWVNDLESAARFYTEKLGLVTQSMDPATTLF